MIDTKALREAARYVKKHEKTKKTYDTCVCNGCVSLNLVINPTTLLALLDHIDRLEAVDAKIAELNARIAELTGALERIAKREGHYFYPDVSGPDEKGMYTVVGPGKPQLTKQCAHWMRSIARQALGSGDTTAKAGEQP
jgi:hypothetical protein